MQFKKVFGFASAFAVLAIASPALYLAPASPPRSVEEKRQAGMIVGSLLLGCAALATSLVVRDLREDIDKRKLFTVTVIDQLKTQAPGKNIVICNVDYSLSCTPEARETVFFRPDATQKISYDIVVFGKGCTFDRKGDGGFQNWAYTAPTGCQIDGGHIAC